MRKYDNLLLSTKKYRKQKEYWFHELMDVKDETLITSTGDNTQVSAGSAAEGKLEYTLPERLAILLLKQGKHSDMSLYVILLSAFICFLYKYSGKTDIIVGIPVTRQPHDSGSMNDMVAIRVGLAGDMTVKDLVICVKEKFVRGVENQDYPFEKIIEELKEKTGFSYDILFNVIFAGSNLHGNPKLFKKRGNRLVVIASRTGFTVKFTLLFSKLKFTRNRASDVKKYFTRVLESFVENVHRELSRVEMLSRAEKHQLLVDFNDNSLEYPAVKTIHHGFEEQVEKIPDQVAVVDGSPVFLTYGKLSRISGNLAAHLGSRGVKPGDIVALEVDRSVEMISGIMGILKAGAAYMPIDPDCPSARKGFMLADSNTCLLVTRRYLSDNQGFKGEVVYLDAPLNASDFKLEENYSSRHAAYVMYTSGSTGRPKGIVIECRGVLNLAAGLSKRVYEIFNRVLKVALVAPYVFDASVQQIFTVLLKGHSLYIVPVKVRMDGKALPDYFVKNQIDISDGTPGHLHLILNQPDGDSSNPAVKHLLIGGETLPVDVVKAFFNRFAANSPAITNVYGPTECCVDSTSYEITNDHLHGKTVPIGNPMPNEQVYILNKEMSLLPVGIAGEIHIGGHGVARGYLNNPELTAEKFKENPYSHPPAHVGDDPTAVGSSPGDYELGYQSDRRELIHQTRSAVPAHHSSFITHHSDLLYKSGDLGRWLPDGNIEFLGRIDTQVKIRGFRIEPAEIELRLTAVDYIKEAVVIEKEREGEKYLCAYLVSEKEIDITQIRRLLLDHLPHYMIPSYFMQVYKLPLTPNGKLDRKALPLPGSSVTADYEAPVSRIEKTVAQLWAEILGTDIALIGRDSNFFEIGGHSLRATTLVSRVHKEFDVKPTIIDIFNRPTLKMLSEYIKEKEKMNRYTALPVAQEKEYYELSSAQKRIYLLHLMKPDNVSYNMPQKIELSDEIDKNKLQSIVNRLIKRHESFRTSFVLIGDFPVQKIYRKIAFEIEYFTRSEADIIEGFVRPFDLSHAPLLRVGLLTSVKKRPILLVDMHHIISDALSHEILIRDFMAFYNGEELAPLRLQYKDYSEWQNSEKESPAIKRQEVYWLKKFMGDIPALNIPMDKARPGIQSLAGCEVIFEINPKLTIRIRDRMSEFGVTLFIFLLAAYNVMLAKYTGQEDIVVGTIADGRSHADLENIIGFFVNMLPLRNKPEPESTAAEFLIKVKQSTLEAYENRDFQYEELISKLGIKREAEKQPLIETVLVLQNAGASPDSPKPHLADYSEQSSRGFRNKTSHFDFWLMAVETAHSIRMMFKYSEELFKRSTIETMAEHYIEVVENVVNNCNMKLGDVSLSHDLLAARPAFFQEDRESFEF